MLPNMRSLVSQVNKISRIHQIAMFCFVLVCLCVILHLLLIKSFVHKAYRVRQGRTFSSSSSSSSAPNRGTDYVVRCLLLMSGFSLGSYMAGDDTDKFEEKMKAHEKDAWDTLAKGREQLNQNKTRVP